MILLAERWFILRKEEKTMTYRKPEVALLGDATRVILQCSQKPTGGSDSHTGCPSSTKANAAAYDLDE